MLQKEGAYNDFTQEFIDKLNKKIDSFGSKVRFKFDISNIDPNPENRAAGMRIYPFSYALDPITFSITDKDDKRPTSQSLKRVGMVAQVEQQNGREVAIRFKRVRIIQKEKGVKDYNLQSDADREEVMYLLLHPKLKDGEFADKARNPMFAVIDERAAASTAMAERSARKKALDAAEQMTDADLKNFADAMVWDSSEDASVLRNMVEEMAETNPVFFNDLIKDDKIKYRSLVKQAMTQGVITFNPGEGKFFYTSNNQPIAHVAVSENKNEVVALAEWLLIGGQKEVEVYKKIKSMLK